MAFCNGTADRTYDIPAADNLFLPTRKRSGNLPWIYSFFLIYHSDDAHGTSNYTICVQDMLHSVQSHWYDVEKYYPHHHSEYPYIRLNASC